MPPPARPSKTRTSDPSGAMASRPPGKRLVLKSLILSPDADHTMMRAAEPVMVLHPFAYPSPPAGPGQRGKPRHRRAGRNLLPRRYGLPGSAAGEFDVRRRPRGAWVPAVPVGDGHGGHGGRR